jgi:hypothetical protein
VAPNLMAAEIKAANPPNVGPGAFSAATASAKLAVQAGIRRRVVELRREKDSLAERGGFEPPEPQGLT